MKKGFLGALAAFILGSQQLNTPHAGSVGFSRWKPPVDENGRIRNLSNHPAGIRAAKREKGRRK